MPSKTPVKQAAKSAAKHAPNGAVHDPYKKLGAAKLL
jgi:hypothetical protein